MPVVTDYTALLSGSYWNGIEVTGQPVIVTFSFPTSLPAYDESIPGFTAATVSSFQAFTATEQAQAIQALNEWAAASGLVFVQVAPGEGDINFQNVDFNTTSSPSYSGAGGIGFYPFGDWNSFSYPYFSGDLDSAGEVFMNTQFISGGAVDYGTLLHEIGHAIGLKHPTEVVTDFAADPDVVHDQVLSSDDPNRTIMATVGSGNPDPHLLQLDKDAAAFIYGTAGTGSVATASASGSNSVSNWSWDASTETLTQTAVTTGEEIRGSSVKDVITGSTGDDHLFGLAGDDSINGGQGNDSLYGGTGSDTLTGGAGDDSYFVSSSTDVIVENASEGNDGVFATVSFTLGDNVESLSLFGSGLTGTANDQGDLLFGDGTFATTLIGGKGSDYMVGGSGDDTLAGGTGPDQLFGQGGADHFVFTALGDAPVGGTLTSIGDFTSGQDKIDLSAITTTGGQPLNFIGTAPFSHTAGEVHQVASGGDTIVEGDVNGDGNADFQILLTGAQTLESTDFLFEPTCFRDGTLILTERGEVAVEALTVGDSIVTVSGRTSPVIWLGHRRVDCTRHPDPRRVWPVRVQAGAFDVDLPRRDLWLSPDHAVLVDGMLIAIRQLINGTTIAQVPVPAVSYHHVELAGPDVLFAESLSAESYIDTGNRGAFINSSGPVSLHPLFAAVKKRDDSIAPVTNDEAHVLPVWQRLATRSLALGQLLPEPSFTDDPDVHLCVDARVIRPTITERHRCMFRLPGDAREIRLVSRSGYPTDERPWVDDTRRLGIYVGGLIWRKGREVHDMPVDHPALCDGWWAVERSATSLRRWTNGAARLPAWPGACELEVLLAGSLSYRVEPVPASAAVPAQLFA